MTYWSKEFVVAPANEAVASSDGSHRKAAPVETVYIPTQVRIVRPTWWGTIVYKGTAYIRFTGVKR